MEWFLEGRRSLSGIKITVLLPLLLLLVSSGCMRSVTAVKPLPPMTGSSALDYATPPIVRDATDKVQASVLNEIAKAVEKRLNEAGLANPQAVTNHRELEIEINGYEIRPIFLRLLSRFSIPTGRDILESRVRVLDATTHALPGEATVSTVTILYLTYTMEIVWLHSKSISSFLRVEGK